MRSVLQESEKLNSLGRIMDNRALVAAVFCTIMAFHVLTLTAYPKPWVDEGLTASRAAAVWETGIQAGELDRRILEATGSSPRVFPFLPYYFYSLAVSLGQPVELWQLRIVNLLFGALLLFTVYGTAASLGGRAMGAFAVLALGTSATFSMGAHVARPDIMGAALGYAALLLFVRNKNSSLWLDIAAGLAAGLAFELHVRASLCGVFVAGLYLQRFGVKVFISRSFWLYVLGGCIGLGVYALLHIVPDHEAASIGRSIFYKSRVPPGGSFDPMVIVYSFIELATSVLQFQPLSILFLTLPLICWRIPNHRNLLIAMLLLSSFFGGALLFQSKAGFKLIMLEPALALCIANIAYQLCCVTWGSKVPRIGFMLSVLFLLSVSIIRNVRFVAYQEAHCTADFDEISSTLDTIVADDDLIVSDETYWLGRQESNYMTWKSLVYYQHYRPDASLIDAFQHFRPTIYISDVHVRYFQSDEPFESPFREGLRTPLADLRLLLGTRGEPLKTIRSACYGLVRVYRLHWDEPTARLEPAPSNAAPKLLGD